MNAQLKPAAFVACLLSLSLLILLLLRPGAGSVPSRQAFSLRSIPSHSPPLAISTVIPPFRPTAGPPDPVATEAAELTAIASAPTRPVETPYVHPLHIALTSREGGSYKTLRKTPPYTLELSGYIESSPAEEKCRDAFWDWGDGTQDTIACQDEAGALYKGRHTYTRVGAYRARLAMTTTGNRGANSDSQTVIIGSTFPNTTPLHDAARWVLWGGALGVMLVFLRWLRRRRTGWARLGFWLVLLALFTYLPPFSYVPNPLGIYWARVGGYSYDLRLPFWNGFAVASLPTENLQRTLDEFIGQRGALDPFDPVQPITGYRFISAYLQRDPASYGNYAHVVTEFTYADGARREVTIPMREDKSMLGAYRMHSAFSMGRLFTQHEEFDMTVFAWKGAPITLATPQRLILHPDAQRWDRYNPGDWVLGSDSPRLVFAPDGNSFLVASAKGNDKRDLLIIKLNGSPPARMAEDVLNYGWSPMAAISFITGRGATTPCSCGRWTEAPHVKLRIRVCSSYQA